MDFKQYALTREMRILNRSLDAGNVAEARRSAKRLLAKIAADGADRLGAQADNVIAKLKEIAGGGPDQA